MDSGTYRDTPTWAETGERGTVTAPGRGDGRRGPPWSPTERPAGRPPDPPEDRKPPSDRLTRTETFSDTGPVTGTLPGSGTVTNGTVPGRTATRTRTLPGPRPVDRPPGIFYRPARPTGDDRPGRWILAAAFWAGLIAAVAPWWFNTPSSTLSNTAAALIAAGRITGLITGYVLLVQVLLMSRVSWLEQVAGARRLLLWHRELGGFLVVGLLSHTVLIILGYARTDHTPFLGETWHILTKYEDMVSAFIATGILVSLGLLGIRAIRRALPYELWYFLHLSSYLILLLAYGHQFANGQEFAGRGLARAFWLGLYGFVLVAVVAGRLIAPLVLNLRHRLRVAEVVDEGSDLFSIYITGRHLDGLDAKAGQFFRWRFLTGSCWWQAHPFSLSAAPNERWLRLTIKTVGDHTGRLRRLTPGVRVFAEGPAGEFTADRRIRPSALLIAGGSGIAPIRALLEELPVGTTLIYRTSNDNDVAFRRELEWLAQAREAKLWYVVGRRDDPGPRNLFTPAGLRELVPDVRQRDVYLCGPAGLIEASRSLLRRMRVPQRQIHLDAFEF
jgi:predicted ferric reductase